MAEMKDYESKVNSNFESNPKRGKQIINIEPSANDATTKVRPSEPEEREEGKTSFTSRCG